MSENIYIGRYVVAAKINTGEIAVGYRVSSRSFANRKIIENGNFFSVVPINPEDYRDNPYISYNCLRGSGNKIIVSNGSHTDPIAEKIDNGYPVRDAIAVSLLALDYEKDNYNTPRITCVADYSKNIATLGIIKLDKLDIREVSLKNGEACLVATYQLTEPWFFKTSAQNTTELTSMLYQMSFTHPVCTIAGVLRNGNIETSIKNP